MVTKIDEIGIVRYGDLDVAVPQAGAKAVNRLFSQRLWPPLHLVPRKNLDRSATEVLSVNGSLIYTPRRRNMRSQQWHPRPFSVWPSGTSGPFLTRTLSS